MMYRGVHSMDAAAAPVPAGVHSSIAQHVRAHTLGGAGRPALGRLARMMATLFGATGAVYFVAVTLHAYLTTHRPIGALVVAEQTLVVVAYLIRRPARVFTHRCGDWLLAFGGTFTPVLLRPDGVHAPWGLTLGLAFQLVGLLLCIWSFLALGRSFGFAAADRGLARQGPYAIVRHPLYASYAVLQTGYLLQSLSLRNAIVVLAATTFNIGRALAEDRILATNRAHADYRRDVPWRLLPGIW
jgi:protein-S-isoprenylcysteine O-methyltransferase Ste14